MPQTSYLKTILTSEGQVDAVGVAVLPGHREGVQASFRLGFHEDGETVVFALNNGIREVTFGVPADIALWFAETAAEEIAARYGFPA